MNEDTREFGCYVYAILCEDTAGAGFVKFGYSTKIDHRISSLLTSCPLPVGYVAVLECFNSFDMKETEKELHKRFADRQAQKEWFRFDFNNPEDKKDFNDGCREVFRKYANSEQAYWSKVDPKKLREAKSAWREQASKNWKARVVDNAFFKNESWMERYTI